VAVLHRTLKAVLLIYLALFIRSGVQAH
jgi:hypothetical protein